MPDVRQGELLAVLSAGAYGFSMSSNYNSRPMAEEVLVDGDQWKEGHFLSTVLNGKQGRIFKSAEPRGASFRRRRTLLPYGLRWTGPAASHNEPNMNMSRKNVATPACA